MMKKTIRFTSYVLVLLGFTAAEGCKDDEKKKPDCYECTYDTDTYEYCFSDKTYWSTRAEFEAFIDMLEADDYVCVVKN